MKGLRNQPLKFCVGIVVCAANHLVPSTPTNSSSSSSCPRCLQGKEQQQQLLQPQVRAAASPAAAHASLRKAAMLHLG
jgi:hypothetical protein